MPRCALFYQRRAMAERDPSQRMVLILPEHSQRPYRYGMTLLCIGAMFNWLGLADNNAEPVRYIGVTLIAAGAMLICLAMCFWMKATHDPQVAALQAEQDAMHHIVTIHRGDSTLEKPPDYDTVTGAAPPSYEDAIKLSPAQLAVDSSSSSDVLDGVKVESRPDLVGGGEGQGSSGDCQVQIIPGATAAKPSDSSSGDEAPGSGSQADNFGSRVLRISRKFLRRSRSAQDVTLPVASESHSSVATPDVSIR